MANTVVSVSDESARGTLSSAFRDQGSVTHVRTVAELRSSLSRDRPDVVVVHERIDGEERGLDAISAVRECDETVPILFRSDASDGELAAAATRAGATEYYPEDASDASLAERVRAALPGDQETANASGIPADAGSGGVPGGSASADSADTDGRSAVSGTRGNDDGETVKPPSTSGGGQADESAAATQDEATTFDRQRYEDLLEAVDDGVYVIDRDGHFVYVNGALEALTGYDRTELIGEHAELLADAETIERARAEVRDIRRGDATDTTFEFQLRRKSGERLTCEDNLTLVTDDDGTVVGTAGIVRDITDRKRRDRHLSNLLQTSQSLMEARSREGVADVVATASLSALEEEFCVIHLFDDERGRLVPVAWSGESQSDFDEREYAVGEGGPGRAFETADPQRDQGDGVAGRNSEGDRAGETLSVPLGSQGALSIVTADPDGFDDAAVSTAEVLASTAAVALDRADRENELLRYRTVIENVQDMVYVIDENEQYSLVTEPLADWLGYDQDDLIGAPPETIFAEAEVETFESTIADLWHGEGDGSRRLETEVVTATGERMPAEVEVSLFPTENSFAGTVGVVRDLRELVRTRELLEEERDRFSYLFDNLPDAVVESSLDEDGHPVVRAVNDAFTEVFGYEADQVVGESLNEFILPDGARAEGAQLDRETATGEITNREVRRKTADGFRDFLFRGIPYDSTEKETHSFGIYTDITVQKERERRLGVLNRVLRHNLRNDVNVVLGHAQLLATEVTDEELESRAASLRDKAAELVALSDRARTLNRMMTRGSPRDSTVDLEALVADLVSEFRIEYPALDVEMNVESGEVVGDARLGLAIRELLDNVVEHVGTDATVRIDTVREGGELHLRFRDDGNGIPDVERAVISESTEITQLNHGSGLGLWIVKWVCESCGGRLAFQTPENGGSAVTISLTPADT